MLTYQFESLLWTITPDHKKSCLSEIGCYLSAGLKASVSIHRFDLSLVYLNFEWITFAIGHFFALINDADIGLVLFGGSYFRFSHLE